MNSRETLTPFEPRNAETAVPNTFDQGVDAAMDPPPEDTEEPSGVTVDLPVGAEG